MQAVNIYALTRLAKCEVFSNFEKALSLREEMLKIKYEEIELIRNLIENMGGDKTPLAILDNWFYSFSIPQIGKEFDLLKIDKNGIVVNLELKSQMVSEKKIEKQLKQNRYYLSHIGKVIYSFTYVKESPWSAQLYVYDGELRKSSLEELIERLAEIKEPIVQNIESYFRPKDFLISPLNTPEKFLSGKYYLSTQQESIKKEVITAAGETGGLWGIQGSAGTGKTLLLYDIAKSLSVKTKVCVIHCGMLSNGHKYINKYANNMQVIDAKSLAKEKLEGYGIVCVDETQRLYTSGLDTILEMYNTGSVKMCIFAYDYAQVLSKTERTRNNPQRLSDINGFTERRLTDKIRTNKEVNSFIRTMMRLDDKPQTQISYSNIDILYANNGREADTLIKSYIKRGYTFITFTPSQYVRSSIDRYSRYINSHQVIGQEFNNVVVVLDNNFRYSKEGILQGRKHPNPDYIFPKLFYQNISRAREKLCIVVLDNIDLFTKLIGIKEHIDM